MMKILFYSLFLLIYCGNSLVAQNYYHALEETQEAVPQNAKIISTVEELIAGLKSNSDLYLQPGNYELKAIVYLTDITNLKVSGADGAVITGELLSLLKFRGVAKNITFKNIMFNSTSTSKNETGGGIVYFDHASAENILFENCDFTCPELNSNGLKFVTEGSARSKTITILNCNFHDIGRMAFETQNHTYDGTIRVSNVKVTNCDFKNLGLQSPYGMAISLSGSDQGAELTGNSIANSKDIGIEIVGWENVLISNNTFSANNSVYQPFSIQKTIGAKDYLTNIKVINNTGSSNTEQGIYNLGFANLDGFVYSGNSFQANWLGLFDVKNSVIVDNVHTSNGKQIFALFDQSHDNSITGNTFITTKDGGDGIVLYPGMTGNTFENTTVILSGTGGNAFIDYGTGINENINMTVK